MGVSTTAYTTIKSYCQDEVGDTTTNISDATNWLLLINQATYEILDDLVEADAVPLFDYLLDNITLTLTAASETVTYAAQITTATKTFYKFYKATWDGVDVKKINFKRWHEIVNEVLNPSLDEPFMTFTGASGVGVFYLRPKPTSSSDTTFIFWWVKPPVAMTDSASSYSSLSEPAIKLYRYLVASYYERRRKNREQAVYEYAEYRRQLKKLTAEYHTSKIYQILSTEKD